MRPCVNHVMFNQDDQLTSVMIEAKRRLEQMSFEIDEIGGGKFRSRLVSELKSNFTHENFLLFNEDTALIVQVSSPGGAYAKLLDVLCCKNNGSIKQCIFVTQTHQLAVKRNQLKNPGSESDGHRVYFSLASDTISKYVNSFLDIPLGILGIDLE